MLLADLVQASAEVSQTRSRKKKLGHLAACLRALSDDEIEIGVAFLSGEIRQGKIALDGVQQSPHYPAGLALRFARVKRYRKDKRADEADTIGTVRALYDRGL